MTEPDTETFFWDATDARLDELQATLPAGHEFRLDATRRRFCAPGLEVTPPLVLPIAADVRTVDDYLDALPPAPTLHFVILLQAGAAALGVFDQGDAVVTKSDKKYVVRGSGKAQPTHLATKGKSRYGSRLRLQNARNLLLEVNRRLAGWIDEFGPPDQVFYNAPVRLWADLCAAKTPPPFRGERAIKIPLDLPVPTTEVLLRTYRRMSFGRVQRGATLGHTGSDQG
jgi:hypothetical protein